MRVNGYEPRSSSGSVTIRQRSRMATLNDKMILEMESYQRHRHTGGKYPTHNTRRPVTHLLKTHLSEPYSRRRKSSGTVFGTAYQGSTDNQDGLEKQRTLKSPLTVEGYLRNEQPILKITPHSDRQQDLLKDMVFVSDRSHYPGSEDEEREYRSLKDQEWAPELIKNGSSEVPRLTKLPSAFSFQKNTLPEHDQDQTVFLSPLQLQDPEPTPVASGRSPMIQEVVRTKTSHLGVPLLMPVLVITLIACLLLFQIIR